MRTFHFSFRDNVKGGCRPSTSLHKWAQGLGLKPDLETYGKKVIVEIE